MEEKIIIEQIQDKLYDDLLEVVKPYLSDFTGYDEKEQCFNIVLAVKELLGQLEQENEELKHKNKNLRLTLKTYEMPEVIKVLTDWRTGELQLKEKRLNKYKYALEEIRQIVEFAIEETLTLGQKNATDMILQIITEAIGGKQCQQ